MYIFVIINVKIGEVSIFFFLSDLASNSKTFNAIETFFFLFLKGE